MLTMEAQCQYHVGRGNFIECNGRRIIAAFQFSFGLADNDSTDCLSCLHFPDSKAINNPSRENRRRPKLLSLFIPPVIQTKNINGQKIIHRADTNN